MLKKSLFGLALTFAVVGGVCFSPAAYAAAHIRDCGSTTAVTDITNPPNANAGFTQTTTTTKTQTPSCNSNSTTNQTLTPTTGPVTNKGGGTPGGF